MRQKPNLKFFTEFFNKYLLISESLFNFALAKAKGAMSEWLGTGLQNRLHQFESGWHLNKNRLISTR